jgi:group I intron endonuclease
MNSGIYLITNTLDGKQYIGQSQRITKRFWRHKDAVKTQNPREAFYLHKAMAKHGVENFTFKVLLHAVDVEYLNLMERRCIEAYKTLSPFGYNLDTGGGVCKKLSEETKLKLSIALKGRPCPTKGRPHSEETKAKMSAALKGRKQTEEHKANSVTARKGYKHSEETRAKLRAVDRSYLSSPEQKARLKAAWAAKRISKANNGN